MAAWPLTTKHELHPPVGRGNWARNLTYRDDNYARYHRTSGTQGKPLVVLDTAADWQWWIDTWQFVLDAAEVTPEDRVAMAFSFGPFIGFWSANDALIARGALVDSLRRDEQCGATAIDLRRAGHDRLLYAQLRTPPGRPRAERKAGPGGFLRCGP